MGDEINKTKLVLGIVITIVGVALLALYFIYAYRFTYNDINHNLYVGFSEAILFETISTLYLYQIGAIVTLIIGCSLLFSCWI